MVPTPQPPLPSHRLPPHMQAYHDYISAIKYERAPQLEVNLPVHLTGAGCTLQSPQGVVGAGTDVPKLEAGDGPGLRQAFEQQGGDTGGVRDQGQVPTSLTAGTEAAAAAGVAGAGAGGMGQGGRGNACEGGAASKGPGADGTSPGVSAGTLSKPPT
eukprot:scaffold22140_cov16-Tisochrysis_lutea.AAC.1